MKLLSNLGYIIKVMSNMYEKRLKGVTFFVTSACNLRCVYCFNRENLGTSGDLSFDEIKKIVHFLPRLYGVLLSGGEPLLRPDIVDICELFAREKGVRSFGIPTNCLNRDNTINKINSIRNKVPDADIVACCALDVFEETNDKYRGAGVYGKAVRTINELSKIKKNDLKIKILINSVIVNESVPRLLEFVDFVKNELDPDLHSLEVVRIDAAQGRNGLCSFTDGDFEIIKKARLKIDRAYRSSDLFLKLYQFRSSLLTQAQSDIYFKRDKWPASCNAGRNSFVIMSNGGLSICEFLPSLGNLRDYDYDYRKILKNYEPIMRGEIRRHACDCMHIVYLKDALDYSIPLLFLRSLFSNKLGKP